jgi:hypothetical protein
MLLVKHNKNKKEKQKTEKQTKRNETEGSKDPSDAYNREVATVLRSVELLREELR